MQSVGANKSEGWCFADRFKCRSSTPEGKRLSVPSLLLWETALQVHECCLKAKGAAGPLQPSSGNPVPHSRQAGDRRVHEGRLDASDSSCHCHQESHAGNAGRRVRRRWYALLPAPITRASKPKCRVCTRAPMFPMLSCILVSKQLVPLQQAWIVPNDSVWSKLSSLWSFWQRSRLLAVDHYLLVFCLLLLPLLLQAHLALNGMPLPFALVCKPELLPPGNGIAPYPSQRDRFRQVVQDKRVWLVDVRKFTKRLDVKTPGWPSDKLLIHGEHASIFEDLLTEPLLDQVCFLPPSLGNPIPLPPSRISYGKCKHSSNCLSLSLPECNLLKAGSHRYIHQQFLQVYEFFIANIA